MKLVMACIDFSKVTPAVIKTAADIAKATGAKLLLFNVVILPAITAFIDAPPTIQEYDWESRELKASRQEITRERDRVERQTGLEVTTRIVEALSPAGCIIDTAERDNPDLIVMGSHGYGPLGRVLLGSTSHGVLHKAKWPVLIVPSAGVVGDTKADEAPAAQQSRADAKR